jgi:hypothetical protein
MLDDAVCEFSATFSSLFLRERKHSSLKSKIVKGEIALFPIEHKRLLGQPVEHIREINQNRFRFVLGLGREHFCLSHNSQLSFVLRKRRDTHRAEFCGRFLNAAKGSEGDGGGKVISAILPPKKGNRWRADIIQKRLNQQQTASLGLSLPSAVGMVVQVVVALWDGIGGSYTHGSIRTPRLQVPHHNAKKKLGRVSP